MSEPEPESAALAGERSETAVAPEPEPTGVEHAGERPETAVAPEPEPTGVERELCLEVACEIARATVKAAVWHERRCGWVGAWPEETARGFEVTYKALGPDLWGGTAGIGVFLAELARASDDREVQACAEGALRHAASRAETADQLTPLGLYGGRGGVALALAYGARLLDEPGLEAAARRIARRSSEDPGGDPAEGAEEFDLVSGHAGSVVALLALAAVLEEPEYVQRAVEHGDALEASAQPDRGGRSWRSPHFAPGEPALAGLSHGAAGVGVALWELAAASGESRFRDTALEAFGYERALFDERVHNWPDLREGVAGANGEGPTYSTYWCHGAPGIALSRLRALELEAPARAGRPQSPRTACARKPTSRWIPPRRGCRRRSTQGLRGGRSATAWPVTRRSLRRAASRAPRRRRSPSAWRPTGSTATGPRSRGGPAVCRGARRPACSSATRAWAASTCAWLSPRCRRCCSSGPRRSPTADAAEKLRAPPTTRPPGAFVWPPGATARSIYTVPDQPPSGPGGPRANEPAGLSADRTERTDPHPPLPRDKRGWQVSPSPDGRGMPEHAQTGPPPHRMRGFWWFVLALLALNWLSLLFFQPSAGEPRVTVPFSPYFLEQVRGGTVGSIASKGDTIQGKFKAKERYPASDKKATPTKLFATQVPAFWNGAELSALLQEKGVRHQRRIDDHEPVAGWRSCCSGSARRC